MQFIKLGHSRVRETTLWSAQLGMKEPHLLVKEEIRIISSLDPVETSKIERHISISVGIVGQIGATRRANEVEFELVKVWAESEFKVKLEEELYGKTNPHVRHLWEML